MAGKSFLVSITIGAKDAASAVLSGISDDLRGVAAASDETTAASERLTAAHEQLQGAQERLADLTRTVTEAEEQAAEGRALNSDQAKAYVGALQGLEEAEAHVTDAEREVTAAQKQHNAAMKQNKVSADELRQAYATLGRQAGILGTAIVGGITASAVAAGKYGQELLEASEKTGIAVEEISALRYAGEQAGVTLSQLETGLGGLARTAVAVATGTRGAEAAAMAYQRLGINVLDAGGNVKDTEALFLEIADALGHVGSNTERAAIAQAIFGISGRELLPLLKDGSAGLEEMTQRARELGIVWEQEDAEAAQAFMQSLTDVKRALGSLGRALLGGDEEARRFFEGLAEGIGTISEFLQQHPTFAKALAGIGIVAGVSLIGVSSLVTGLLGLSATITAVQTIVGALSVGGGAASFAGLSASGAGVAATITGSVIPAIVAIAPYAAIAAAAIAAIALAWRDAIVVMETYAERAGRIAQEEAAREKYLTPEQRAEIEGVKPTTRDIISGWFTGGGETGRSLAQARAYQEQGYTLEQQRQMGQQINVYIGDEKLREISRDESQREIRTSMEMAR